MVLRGFRPPVLVFERTTRGSFAGRPVAPSSTKSETDTRNQFAGSIAGDPCCSFGSERLDNLRDNSSCVFHIKPGAGNSKNWNQSVRRSALIPAMPGAHESVEGDGSTAVKKYGRGSMSGLQVKFFENDAIEDIKERYEDKKKIEAKPTEGLGQKYGAGDATELDNSHQRGGVRSWVNDKLSSLFSGLEKFPEFLASGMRSSLQHLGKGWDKHFGEPVFIMCDDTKVYQETYRVFSSKTKLFGVHKHINEMDDDEKKQKGIKTGVNFSEAAVNEKSGIIKSVENFQSNSLGESDVWIVGWVEEAGG